MNDLLRVKTGAFGGNSERFRFFRVVASLFFAIALFSSPSLALGEIRIVAPSDTSGANYQDVSITIGDTATLEVWVEADSLINGFSFFAKYDGQGLKLMEGSSASDSFPPASLGIQANEDHTTFGDVLRNRGVWNGLSTDTFEYAALTNSDSVSGSYRAAVLSFVGQSTGTWSITYVFDTTTNKITAITAANGNANDLFSSGDTGVILITVGDTPVILSLDFVSDTPSRFDQDTPFNTSPSGDTVWFAAETQVVTLTVNFVSNNPDSLMVGAVFDSGTQIDTQAPYQVQFFIRPAHAVTETFVLTTVYDVSGGFDTTIIYFAPDTVAPDTVTPLSPSTGSLETMPVLVWTQSSDSGSGVSGYTVQVATDSNFSSIVATETTSYPDTDAAITNLTDGIYYWRVIATDSTLNSIQSGLLWDSFIVSTDTIAPETFALLLPLNGIETSATTFNFQWSAASDSSQVSYRLIIDTDMAGSYVIDTTVYDTAEIISLPANDTYYWRVIATDTTSNSRQAGDSFVVVDTITPSAFLLTAPLDGTDTNEVSVTFLWSASSDTGSGISYYRLQVDTAGTFVQPFKDSITPLTYGTLTLPANDTYSWRVIAADDAGNTTTASAQFIFVDTTTPLPPVLNVYQDTIVNPPVTLSWSASQDSISGLAYYVVQVDTAGTFAVLLESVTIFAGDTDYVSALAAEETYYWRVLAYDTAGNNSVSTPSSDSYQIVLLDTTSPSAFNLTSPADGLNTSTISLTLWWQNSIDDSSPPVRYRIQADTAGTFAAPYIDTTGLLDTFYIATLVANDTTWWRVIAVDNSGNTVAAANAPWKVYADTAGPIAGTLISPANSLDTTSTIILFSWNSASDTGSGLAYYLLQIDTVSTFAAPIVDSSTPLTSGSRTLSANDTYYWRVVAVDNVGNTTAVSSRIIRIDTAPPTLPILTKYSGAYTTPPVTLSWSASQDSISGLTYYNIQIDTVGTFVSLLDSATLIPPDTNYVTGVLTTDTYYWRVLAYDTLGNVSTSSTDSFRVPIGDTIGPNAFDLLSPADLDITSSTLITLNWEDAIDDTSPPVTYRLQVDTAGTFAASVLDTSWMTETSYSAILSANNTYYWRVTARDNNSNTTVCNFDFSFTIDTAPPTRTILFAHNGASVVSPILLKWFESTDTIVGLDSYLIQVSTVSNFATIADSEVILAGDTDHWTPLLASQTYYWRVYAYDFLGNVSTSSPTYDSFIVRADTAPPVTESSAILPTSSSNSGTSVVTLTVYVTDSAYVDTVFADLSGFGLTDSYFFTPSSSPPSTDSVWTATVTLDSDISGGTYDILVYVVDASNNVSTTTIQLTVVDTSPSLAEIIDTPLFEIRAAGNELSIISTYGDSYQQVLYEYRTAPNGAWRRCTSSVYSANPDTEPPFWGFYWDISDLISGQKYDVRARATDSNGYTDPNPSYYRITVDPTDSTVHEYRDGSTFYHVRRQEIRPDTTNKVMIADGNGAIIPPGAVSETVWIRVTVLDTVPTTTPLGGAWVAEVSGRAVEYEREDGLRNFDSNLIVVISYADTDLENDYVGQTTVLEADLKICYYDEVTGAWIPLPTSQVDPVMNVVRAEVNHFTLFAVLSPVPAAGNLKNVIVYPNPFIPYDNVDKNGRAYNASDPTSGIIFDSLPQQVTIDIYDIAGRLVSHFAKNSAWGRYNWDAHDDNGREVASGMYIAILTSSNGERVVKKIMIIK